MALLAGKRYDPAVAVQVSTASLTAMTAFDTTNLRVTFTAPASGTVFVRCRAMVSGATTAPRVFLGVLDGATVKMRGLPYGQQQSATGYTQQEAIGIVTGLTPGNSYTWDMAYGVEVVVAATNISYGGPNDAAGADAFGAALFEVWDAASLLAGVMYDPASSASKGVASLAAMTAFDTTNLRLTVTAPASGNIFWRARVLFTGSGTLPSLFLGILESTTVVARQAPLIANTNGSSGSGTWVFDGSGVMTGVSAGSHTYDLAYGVQVVGGAGAALKYGGPNDTTSNNAFGGLLFELWTA